MDRRGFLKLIGLGGTALLAPKPLGIVAARMADLTDPPLHVGLARFRGLADFPLYGMSLASEASDWSGVPAYFDFIQNWHVRVVVRRDGARSYAEILHGPAADFLPPFGVDVTPGFLYGLQPSDVVEVWFSPSGKPRFPLTPMKAILLGPPEHLMSRAGPRARVAAPIRAVRLERSRAIELGLASTADPYEVV
jgi:hypothetical protein